MLEFVCLEPVYLGKTRVLFMRELFGKEREPIVFESGTTQLPVLRQVTVFASEPRSRSTTAAELVIMFHISSLLSGRRVSGKYD